MTMLYNNLKCRWPGCVATSVSVTCAEASVEPDIVAEQAISLTFSVTVAGL